MIRFNIIFMLLISFSCLNCATEEEIKVSEIVIDNIDENGLTLALNETFQIEAQTTPGNADRGGITYLSGDESIFVVSARGLIQPEGLGETILTVMTQDGTNLYTDRKIVIDPPVIPIESIEIEGLENGTLYVPYNYEQQVSVKLTPDDSDPLMDFESSDTAVFTVDANGFVKGLTLDGEATLTVSSTRNPDIKATCLVSVLDASVTDIVVPGERIELNDVGETFDLKKHIEVIPVYASLAALQYQSSDMAVVSVDGNGVLTARGRGEALITISSGGDEPIERTVDVRVEAEISSYAGWEVTASSYNASQGSPGAILLDGTSPFWHSQWEGTTAPLPHWLLIDMKQQHTVMEVLLERRGTNTDLRKAVLEISEDNDTYTEAGEFDWGDAPSSDNLRRVTFPKQKVRYIRITITESNRSPFASVNRVRIYEASE